LQTGLAWIVAGGAGNLIDRIMYGHVIDYISVGTFPVWNFADMCIVGGCILLGIYILFLHGRDKDKDTAETLPDSGPDD
jgi:signal peptidase II